MRNNCLCYVQVIVHDWDVQADMVHALWRDVKDNGLIISGIQGVFLCCGLLLFQASSITNEGYFHIGICSERKPLSVQLI